MSDRNSIEIVYALPREQTLFKLQVPPATTAAEAIGLSGILQAYPDIDPGRNRLGIFGKLIQAETPLRDRDRIEIYRPLLADPKEVRRKRAGEGKAMKKGGEAAS